MAGMMDGGPHPNSVELRQAFRKVAGSVNILTTAEGCTPYGMVATAVLSLSLEPPMIGVCINRSASIHEPVTQSGVFCVNILSSDDEEVSRQFSALKGEARFSFGDWLKGSQERFAGVPYLASGQASLFCAVKQTVDCGTHTLVIGTLQHIFQGSGDEPLVYCDGRYGGFLPSSASHSHVRGLESHDVLTFWN
jgi:flavin reductase (DIM6/NTAB) family NADH-FMN oxidoreductase RutF